MTDFPPSLQPYLPILLVACLLLLPVWYACAPAETHGQQADERVAADTTMRVLVFSKTEGFRHRSIPDGKTAILELAAAHGFTADTTEQSDAFTDENLARYAVVVFLNTTGDVLDDDQQAAFERFIQQGGGFAGVHSATDTEYDWPWYGELVGTYFDSHPAVQPAVWRVVDRGHPSTEMLPEAWARTDEWYNYLEVPEGVQVLAYLDESTYEGGQMGDDHPAAWYHEYDGGRAWYTLGGHVPDVYRDDLFRAHLLGGIRWAAGDTP